LKLTATDKHILDEQESMMAAEETKDSGSKDIIVTPTKKGLHLHVKWATVALLLGAGGLFGGRELLPAGNTTADAITTMRTSFETHCKTQAETEIRSREGNAEMRTELRTMHDDVRYIKQMLMSHSKSTTPDAEPDNY
jgi:hypothetical protein